MPNYPTSVYSPREKANRPGITYDPDNKYAGYAEDVTNLDAEVVAIETDLEGSVKPDLAAVISAEAALESDVNDNVKPPLLSVIAAESALATDVNNNVKPPLAQIISDFASALVLNPGHMHSSLCASDGNPSQAVYVDATGCVGIGTTTPGAKLDVVGVIRVNNSGENNSIFEYLDTNGTLKKVTTSGVNQITFDATHVIADYSIGLRNFRGDKVGLESDASGTYLALAAGGASGSEKMRITSTGNVGIGTTSPSGKLDVNDNKVRIRMAKTPSSAGDTGNAGEVCWDSGYIYVCIATNSWVRGPLAAW